MHAIFVASLLFQCGSLAVHLACQTEFQVTHSDECVEMRVTLIIAWNASTFTQIVLHSFVTNLPTIKLDHRQ